ncbi:MAG: Xanthine dehydrogenase [Ferruginibacter sp.]|uniref:XdhC family protein n=1 Tax=Ferruginibacter sp. TaxID=1940288 RepID=UPI002657ED92|nr:XdhC/CoxI family protein [Ferruginibacter sp.]MDB5276482.1 Xanthine dehydrogenase [Ferruginibacter sp.]
MKEINDIIKAYDEAQQKGEQSALATVVHVAGSSYRREGARMLITEQGQLTGAISGGCLEGDALRKALLAMAQQRPMLVTYDTNDEDDATIGLGLGCNGIIQVLIEPIDGSRPGNPIALLRAITSKRQHSVLVTLFSLHDKRAIQPGTCMMVTADCCIANDSIPLKDILIKDAGLVLHQQQSLFKELEFESAPLNAFIEMIPPAVALIIIGAGNDTIPLVKMADMLGWQSTIVDGRPEYAKAERFTASCQVLLSKPENLLDKISIDDHTVFLLMTHNYNYDMAMLPVLLANNVVYAGMLGPRKKRDRMLQELQDKGISFTPTQLSVLHSPIGLDIGAETPEEIALSVIAEIKAVLSGKKGSPLAANNSPVIHSRAVLKA